MEVTSVQFSSVVQLCPTLCNPMNAARPGLPVHHQLPEFIQTHVHCVSDAIQPSHPLSSPSPPALNLSQHQGLCKWVSSPHQVTKVLEFQLQHQSLQWTPRTNLLFRMDWLDLLAVQGTLKSLLQHHSSKASILRHSRKLPRTIIKWTLMYIPHDLIKNINHKSLQSYPTLCNPMDCSRPGSSVHGILQTRILEWVVMTFSRGSFPAKDWIHVSYVSCIGRWVLYP